MKVEVLFSDSEKSHFWLLTTVLAFDALGRTKLLEEDAEYVRISFFSTFTNAPTNRCHNGIPYKSNDNNHHISA